MAIPGWQEILLPLLAQVKDGSEHTLSSCKTVLAEHFQLSQAERLEPSSSGRHRVFDNRVEWAKFYLSKAKLIDSTGHGKFRITARGSAILDIEPTHLNMKFLFVFAEFVQFRNPTSSKIFVSHSSDTLEFCQLLVQGLKSKSLEVWYDENNLHNGAINAEIEDELLASDVFVLILSPKAVASQWVRQEYQAALDLLHTGSVKAFIPVLAMECEVPLFVKIHKVVTANDFQPINPQNAVKRIIHIIEEVHQNTETE